MIFGANVGVELGAEFSVAAGETYTWVHTFGNWFTTHFAHALFDALGGRSVDYTSILHNAAQDVVSQEREQGCFG